MAKSLPLFVLLIRGTFSASVESCGAAGDHLSNIKISISPDPIQKAQPFTLAFSGDLDEALEGGTVFADLHVSALGVIKKDISNISTPFTVSPGVTKGPQSFSVGPISLPKDLPGDAIVKGKVRMTNAKGEPVACLSLDLTVPALGDKDTVDAVSVVAPKTSGCGDKASDHLKNMKIDKSADNVTTITGDLDEALTKMSVVADLKVKISFFNIPVQLTIPISYSPGIPQGSLKITGGPVNNPALQDLQVAGAPEISGTVKFNDGNSEEVACVDVTPPANVVGETSVLV